MWIPPAEWVVAIGVIIGAIAEIWYRLIRRSEEKEKKKEEWIESEFKPFLDQLDKLLENVEGRKNYELSETPRDLRTEWFEEKVEKLGGKVKSYNYHLSVLRELTKGRLRKIASKSKIKEKFDEMGRGRFEDFLTDMSEPLMKEEEINPSWYRDWIQKHKPGMLERMKNISGFEKETERIVSRVNREIQDDELIQNTKKKLDPLISEIKETAKEILKPAKEKRITW